MIDLKDITLVNVNCVDVKTSVKALRFCSKHITFNSALLFSNISPLQYFTEQETHNLYYKWHKIDPITSIEEYNNFMLTKLVDYINTDFCLVVQNDGFVINPHLWDSKFKQYDYIGAPWSMHGMRVWNRTNRIGNGGFSFRSLKLLKFLKEQHNTKPFDFTEAEDVTISKIIEQYNFKYPDVETACKFSLECPVEDYPFDLTKSFGFHGKVVYNNLYNLCPSVFNL
jgi:hypothetical protein